MIILIKINNDEFLLLKKYLLESCGLDIPVEKKYLFNTRLCELIRENNFKSFSDLYLNLKNGVSKELQKKIIEYMTTQETSFFRDTHPFETLQNIIIPGILSNKLKSSQLSPKICMWSAACSTGQEAYSTAMILKEEIDNNNSLNTKDIYILSTDISKSALEKAKKGLYTDDEVKKGMREKYKGKYIKIKKNNMWQITDEIKGMIEFKKINLSRNFSNNLPFFDIIFCRNTIIYFSKELKLKIIKQFYELLDYNGILIMGAAENLYNITDSFKTEYMGQTTIYRVKK